MKSSMINMRKDLESTIKLKANIEKTYQPLTIELVKGLTEKMQPEVLKDIDIVKGKELKRAGMKSVSDVFTATPATVSGATKERVDNATKYIDYAEDMIMKITREIYKELKKAKITNKKALNKVDIKTFAKKIDMSESTVKKVISDIQNKGYK